MKRSPLARRTPLKAKPELKRTTAIGRSPQARSVLHAESAERRALPKRRPAAPAIPAEVRIGLAVRSGGMCEIAAPGCTGTATDASHRLKVGMGGRKRAAAVAHHVLSNLLHACRVCHGQQLHAEPNAAYAAGWMLREGQDPLAAPVRYRGCWMWLADDGSVLYFPATAEEATQ